MNLAVMLIRDIDTFVSLHFRLCGRLAALMHYEIHVDLVTWALLFNDVTASLCDL